MSDTEEAPDYDPKFDLHCLALGKLCVAWAVLDRHLKALIAEMAGCSVQAVASLQASDNVAPRCEAAKKLAYLHQYSREWREAFCKLMDRVIALGVTRNRFIHDYWTFSSGTLERLDSRARLESLGAGEGRKLAFETWHQALPEEVTDLTVQILQVAIFIRIADMDVRHRDEQGQLSKPIRLTQVWGKTAAQASGRPSPQEPQPPRQSSPK